MMRNDEHRYITRIPEGRRGDPEARSTRRGFLRGGAVAAAAAGVALGAGAVAEAAGNVNIIPSIPEYPGWNKRNFEQIMVDEDNHVTFLLNALGAMARPMPTFKNLLMPNAQTFAQTSFVLENTGVDAYLGAAPALYSKAYLAAAGSILTIEARHSGYLGTLLNQTTDLFGKSFDEPTSQTVVVHNAAPFIANLNGGPPLGYDPNNPSPANDIAILNTALALEYLEKAFYDLNVPRFFNF